MSQETIEFFWDVGSPYTFLASTRIEQLAQACNAQAQWRPFLLGGVFRETGNRPPLEIPAKLNYMLDDLKTWAAHYKIDFAFPSVFPINSLIPMRAAVGADTLGKGKEFAAAMACTGKYNAARFEADVLSGIKRLLKKDKDITVIMLECTELSPHAVAVQKLTKMPVWDYTSLTNWIYSGCVRRPFVGHI